MFIGKFRGRTALEDNTLPERRSARGAVPWEKPYPRARVPDAAVLAVVKRIKLGPGALRGQGIAPVAVQILQPEEAVAGKVRDL